MSLATYGDLKTSIAAWATYSDLTTVIPDFVTWAHQEICRRLRANFMLTSADVTLSAETVTAPTRCAAIRRAYLDLSPRIQLDVVSPESAADLASQNSSVTYPGAVTVEGSNLRFAPVFTSTTAVAKVLYYQKPATLTQDADTNTVLTAYPFLYLWGSLEALHTYKEDDNNADRFGAKFGALIESINKSEAKDAMSGPLQSQRYGGGVI